jgi:hypothetical protein
MYYYYQNSYTTNPSLITRTDKKIILETNWTIYTDNVYTHLYHIKQPYIM